MSPRSSSCWPLISWAAPPRTCSHLRAFVDIDADPAHLLLVAADGTQILATMQPTRMDYRTWPAPGVAAAYRKSILFRWASGWDQVGRTRTVGDDRSVIVGALETACPGCQVRLQAIDAPTHPYMTCSPACWVRYGDLLAAQYTDPLRMAFHQLVVDTYAVQHPDGDDARAIQSVGIHLMTLCLFLERGTDPSLGTRLHRRMVDRPVFHQLDSPPSRGRLTMLDVPLEGDAAGARAAAYAWARDVWTAWETHHQTVREWVDMSGLGS